MNKVSIVIPVYNVDGYLRQFLDSIVSQTYRNLEILLVDDGSTDSSGHICDEYAHQDPRITVIHQQNTGAANAKNAGIDGATGYYITFADSDDYVEPNWIEKMVGTAETCEADVVECNFDKVYKNRSELGNQYTEHRISYTAEAYLEQYLGNWTCSLFWNKLFRAELMQNIRFRKERRCIDDEFFTYKVLSGAKRIVRIGDILYHYRQRASSAVSSTKNRMQIADDALEVLIERYHWIKQRYPRLRKTYLTHDVEIMFDFARKFEYNHATKKKFHAIAKVLLKECFFVRPTLLTFRYAVRLQRLKLCNDVPNQDKGTPCDMEEYYP